MAGEASIQNGKKGGRPKGSKAAHTLEASKMREFVIEKVRQRAEELIEAQMALALGCYSEKEVDGDKMVVYSTLPNGNAIQYLLNQAIGKPKETIESQEAVSFIFDV